MQYDKEHQEVMAKTYMNQINNLASFPEVNPNPVLKMDIEGKLLYINPGGKKILTDFELSNEDTEKILPEDFKSLIAESIEKKREVEKEVKTNGKVFSFKFSPFSDNGSVIVTGNEITHLREMEEELRIFNQSLTTLVKEKTQELEETRDVTILSLGTLAEIRDPETGEHLERTRIYVKLLAEELKDYPEYEDYLTDEKIEELYKSTPLHDIGKVGIRDSILLKPGHLTNEEFQEMKKHTIYGANALKWAEKKLGFDSFLSLASEIANYHHERWDGKGYPKG